MYAIGMIKRITEGKNCNIEGKKKEIDYLSSNLVAYINLDQLSILICGKHLIVYN